MGSAAQDPSATPGERVQHFAAKILSKWWWESPSMLTHQLRWPPLPSRRELMRLSVCDRILRDESLTPSTVFVGHPRPSRTHHNSHPLFYPRLATSQHTHSYCISVSPIWNTLPDAIISRGSHSVFKLVKPLFKPTANCLFDVPVCVLYGEGAHMS